jgi:hypothetical protein
MFLLICANVDKNLPFSREAFSVFYQSLDVMWKAMAGIFGVILVFYLVIKLLGIVRDPK